MQKKTKRTFLSEEERKSAIARAYKETTCATIKKAKTDISLKALNRQKQDKRKLTLIDVYQFVGSSWFLMLCTFSMQDPFKTKKEFEKQLDERCEYFSINKKEIEKWQMI